MNVSDLNRALLNIDEKYLSLADSDEKEIIHMKRKHKTRCALLIAACLVLVLGSAYAANLFDLKTLWGTLPEEAEPYIHEESAQVTENGITCRVNQSLCDAANVMVTVTISSDGKYMVVPTDAIPEENASTLGFTYDGTLGEYAESLGKTLLYTGAVVSKIGDEEIGDSSQRMENITESEMVILTRCTKTVSSAALDAVCTVYLRVEGSDDVQYMELPITLSEAPATAEEMRYTPVDADAVEGLHVGTITMSQTPLGTNLSFPLSETQTGRMDDVMTVRIDGLEESNYESVFSPTEDGGYLYYAYMCAGALDDTLTVRFLNWDKQPIGEISFKREK